MRRTMMMVIMWAALAMSVLAMADDQAMPPEATGTPTPPVRSTVDVHPLAGGLVDTGVITPHESTQLTQSQTASPAPHRRARVWTWEEVDHHPVRSTGD